MDTFSPTLITFIIYLVGVLAIGVIAYVRTKNFSDYILGGRSLGSFVTAMSAGASDMSGWLLMGLPGAIWLFGLSKSWIAIGLIIGSYLNWLLVSGRLRMYTEVNNNALTLPNYFYERFSYNGQTLKIFSSLVILFFFTIYCASGVVAGARLFESLFEMEYTNALILGAAATIAYTFIGGFLAVSWTDTIQATLMLFALILTPVMIIISTGGWDSITTAIDTAGISHNIEYSSLTSGTSMISIVSAAAWGLGYFGQPHILARFMAAGTVKSLTNARRIGITWMILCMGGAVSIGYFGIGYFQAFPENAAGVNADNERIFIELVQYLFNPWLAGILLSAILAAVMSTLSCQLLVCSSSLTEDFYKGFIRRNAQQKELVWVGRLTVLLVAVIAILLALNPDSKVLDLVSHAWAGFGAAFGPLVLFSIFWRRINGYGALAGIISGALIVIIWPIAFGDTLYEIVPGFIGSSVAIVAVSLLTPPPQTRITDTFDKAKALYKRHS